MPLYTKEALKELVARGLLFRQEEQKRYDLHPIVRQYVYDRLGDKAAAHGALKDYFATVPKPEEIKSVEDLQPAIELFHHTIAAGGYGEAFRVYRDRLANTLYYLLGAYVEDISLKKAFFPDGESKLPRLGNMSWQAYILNDLALAYDKTGESQKAEGLKERHNTICEQMGYNKSLSSGLRNLAISQIALGKMRKAEINLRRKIELDRDMASDYDEAEGHTGNTFTHVYYGSPVQSNNGWGT
jgi:tetratricopeptide (TPR) repeat protein